MPEVNNAGVRIRYDVHGQGAPLVLIHGWSCEGRYWGEFGYVEKLSEEFTVIVPDLRGHGASDKPSNGDYTDAAFASDVIAVLDDIGIDSAHMFGYSLGGWIVFEMLANNSARIKAAIVGGAHPYAEDTSALRGFPPHALVSYWEALGAPLSGDSKRKVAAFQQQELADMIPDRIDTSARLANVGVRVLMICGTNDGSNRFRAARLLKQCMTSAVIVGASSSIRSTERVEQEDQNVDNDRGSGTRVRRQLLGVTQAAASGGRHIRHPHVF